MNNSLLERNEMFASLPENSKRRFLEFINNNDVMETNGNTREWKLQNMIDMTEIWPEIVVIDLKGTVDWPFLFEIADPVHLVHVLLISYGKPKTAVEVDLTLRLLKIMEKMDASFSELCSSVNVGVDWIPLTGWNLSELALVCQCHPVLIEYLMEESATSTHFRPSFALLAAVLGQQMGFAERIVTTFPSACFGYIPAMSRYYGEWRDVDTSVFQFLFSKPEVDWAIQFLGFCFQNYESSGDVPDCLSVDDTHWQSQTASRTKALMISKYLVDQKQDHFEMAASNWTMDGLCCLMSELEANTFIEGLHFHIPQRLMECEQVRVGYTRMIQRMSNLRSVFFALDRLSLNDDTITHGILDSFAEALPNGHLKEVEFYGTTGNDVQPSVLPGSASLERILNTVERVAVYGTQIQGDAVDFLVRATSESPTLKDLSMGDCDIVRPETWSAIQSDQDIPSPRQLRTNLRVSDLTVSSSNVLGEAFDRYKSAKIGTFESFSEPSSGLLSLITRSRRVTLNTGMELDSTHINCLSSAIKLAPDLEKLVLHVCFCFIPMEETRGLFDSVTAAIRDGRLVDVSCPESLLRYRNASFDVWERLRNLHVSYELSDDYHYGDDVAPSRSEVEHLGRDLIGLVERSTSLRSFTSGCVIGEGQYSILRHLVVCRFAGLSEVCDVGATMQTVIRVVAKVWEAEESLVYDIGQHEDCVVDEYEIDHKTAMVSAAFAVVRESAGIIASWCTTNHWRWRKQHESDETEAPRESQNDASVVPPSNVP